MTDWGNKKPVQLAKNYDDLSRPQLCRLLEASEWYVFEKYDGVLAFAVADKDHPRNGEVFSRTGKKYHMPRIERKALDLAEEGNKVVLILELWEDGVPVNTISGRVRKSSDPYPECEAVLHDMIPTQDFLDGYCPLPFRTRWFLMSTLVPDGLFIRPCVVYSGSPNRLSEGEVRQMVDEVEAYREFGEGIVIRIEGGAWKAGARNEHIVKLKRDCTYDLEVVGATEGKGKYKGLIGGLVVRFRADGNPAGSVIEIPVSGFSDELRQWLTENIDDVIGRIIEVQAMGVYPGGALREPRFKRFRDDKEEADL